MPSKRTHTGTSISSGLSRQPRGRALSRAGQVQGSSRRPAHHDHGWYHSGDSSSAHRDRSSFRRHPPRLPFPRQACPRRGGRKRRPGRLSPVGPVSCLLLGKGSRTMASRCLAWPCFSIIPLCTGVYLCGGDQGTRFPHIRPHQVTCPRQGIKGVGAGGTHRPRTTSTFVCARAPARCPGFRPLALLVTDACASLSACLSLACLRLRLHAVYPL